MYSQGPLRIQMPWFQIHMSTKSMEAPGLVSAVGEITTNPVHLVPNDQELPFFSHPISVKNRRRCLNHSACSLSTSTSAICLFRQILGKSVVTHRKHLPNLIPIRHLTPHFVLSSYHIFRGRSCQK